MSSSGKSALRSHRTRMARRGFVRVEVNVRKEDANLIRDVAAALCDPSPRRRLPGSPSVSLSGVHSCSRARACAAGIATALELATAPARAATHLPLLVLVTDGWATAAPDGVDPVSAAQEMAAAVRRRQIGAVVVDAEDGPTRLGLARTLAETMGALYLTVPELSAGSLDAAVRRATIDWP